MKNKKLPVTIFVFILLIQFFTQTAAAQITAGMPDPSFGTNGQVITSPPNNLGNYSFKDFAIQPDGKIIAAGSWAYVGMDASFWRFLVIRYNSDGSLDTTFGSNGVVVNDFGSVADLRSIAVQLDGKILAAGKLHNRTDSINREDIIIVRYNSDGSLDNSFGEGGIVKTDLASFEEISRDEARTIYSLPDGKILVVGFRSARHFNYDNPVYNSTVILRYNADGTLDDNFGNYGKVVSNILTENEVPVSSVLLNDSKILVSGFSYFKSSERRAIISRYDSQGNFDTSFTANSLPELNPEGTGKIIVLPNQKILIQHYPNFYLLNADGSFDRLFLTQNQIPLYVKDFAVQPDGKIVFLGEYYQSGIYSLRFARFHPNGQVDTSFGTNGVFSQSTNFPMTADKVFIQPDGKILASAVISPNQSGFGFLRQLGDPQIKKVLNLKRKSKSFQFAGSNRFCLKIFHKTIFPAR